MASRARDDYVIEWLPAVEYVELYVYKHFFSVIASHRPEEQHTLVRSTGLELGVFSIPNNSFIFVIALLTT